MSFSAPGSPPQPQPGEPYPAQGRYPGQYPPPLVDVLRSPQGLATALTIVLSIAAAVNLYAAGANVYARSLMTDLIADPGTVSEASLNLSDVMTRTAGSLQLLTLIGTAALFVTWFYRVRVNGEIFRRDGFTQTRGWAIGGWFIPFGNLFFPYRTALEIWAASTQQAPDGSYRQVSTAPVSAWWALWVLAVIGDRVFSVVYARAETPEALRSASSVGVVSDLLMVAAAVLAVVFVRRLTALQNTKAAQGPNAVV
ncbi:DUF4328 domain-containing protein [Streptomyces sp. NPDC059072]|uniref:DUF4328 domain-containing protein n=1 Tax=Streptomyces sp. NPDC059072 TaxID=3346715 RepID=UPI0036C02CF9